MSIYVIGVDPGDSTGVALFQDGRLVHALQATQNEALTFIEVLLDRVNPTDHVTIACERFVSMRGSRTTHQPSAQRIGGAVERLAKRYNARFVWQGPADARAVAPNHVLKLMGVYQTGSDVDRPDANDVNMAIRHAVLVHAKHHARLFERMLEDTKAG